jgi:hypothetical protein
VTRRRVLLILAGAGVAAAAAIAVVVLLALDDDLAPAPALPPGPPVVAQASFAPAVHFFGDVVIGHVQVVADRKRVDAGSIRLDAPTEPYVRAGRPRVTRTARGGVERIDYRLRLVCLRADCTLSGPSSPREGAPTQKTFRIPPATVSYRLRNRDAAARVTADWPALTVATRIGSARPDDFAFTTDLAVPKASYSVRPELLVGVLIVLGLVLVLVPLAVALRHVPGRLLRGARGPEQTRLERALLLLDDSEARDAAERRRALERVALELGREGRGGLAEEPRVAAWSRPDPDPGVASAISAEVRRQR